MAAKSVIALAGRRIDPEGADFRRFPLENQTIVRNRIRESLIELEAFMLVCSAAAGADLIALEVARQLGLRYRVVIPFSIEKFKATSVADRPGSWGTSYDSIVEDAAHQYELLVMEIDGEPIEAYRRVNETILEEAQTLATPDGEALALIVWEGRARNGNDLTAEFAQAAMRKSMRVSEISTL